MKCRVSNYLLSGSIPRKANKEMKNKVLSIELMPQTSIHLFMEDSHGGSPCLGHAEGR